jgi:hypothetical protein
VGDSPGILDCDAFVPGNTIYYINYVGTYGSSCGRRPLQKANGVFVYGFNSPTRDYPGMAGGLNSGGGYGNPGYCLIEWFA